MVAKFQSQLFFRYLFRLLHNSFPVPLPGAPFEFVSDFTSNDNESACVESYLGGELPSRKAPTLMERREIAQKLRPHLVECEKSNWIPHEVSDVAQRNLSPAQHLPPEILGQIFKNCLEFGEMIRPSVDEAPWILGQICVSWRDTALRTPSIWSSLFIFTSTRQPRLPPALVQEWIDRSGTNMLSLGLQGNNRFASSYLNEILCVFCNNLNRCKILHLDLPNQFHFNDSKDSLRIYSGEKAMLERISLNLGMSPSGPLKHVFSMLEDMPRLRDVKWSVPFWTLPSTKLPWTQITNLWSNDDITADQCLNILHRCPNLVSCTFKHIAEYEEKDGIVWDVRNSEMQSLYLCVDEELVPYLLDASSLPALRDLVLQCHPIDDQEYPYRDLSLSNFLSRSLPPLFSLDLVNTGIHESELIDCLRLTSDTLTSLVLEEELDIPLITDHTIQFLTYGASPQAQTLCPKLEMMEFRGCIGSSDGYLASMIKSRWKRPSSLAATTCKGWSVIQQVVVRFSDLNHVCDMELLQTLQRAGLDVCQG